MVLLCVDVHLLSASVPSVQRTHDDDSAVSKLQKQCFAFTLFFFLTPLDYLWHNTRKDLRSCFLLLHAFLTFFCFFSFKIEMKCEAEGKSSTHTRRSCVCVCVWSVAVRIVKGVVESSKECRRVQLCWTHGCVFVCGWVYAVWGSSKHFHAHTRTHKHTPIE